jgi:hypothetical protein
MITQLAPVQFNFRMRWNSEIRRLADQPSLKSAFGKIREYYEAIADCKNDSDHNLYPREWALAEYELDLHIARVKCFDLDWLQETFEGIDLYDLSLAIAETLYPEQQWEVLELNEDAIVTNTERSLVFDLKHYNKLSASASLGLVGIIGPNDLEVVNEVLHIKNSRMNRNLDAISQMKALLANSDKPNSVLDFKTGAPHE